MALFRETALGPRPITGGRSKTLLTGDLWFPCKVGNPFVSQTAYSWTVPVTGEYTIYAWSGGRHSDSVDSNSGASGAEGGAAGGFSRKTATLIKGQVLTISVGRGGRRDRSSTLEAGATTVTGGGLSINCPAPSGLPRNPAATPTGGDVNIQGGAGGYHNGSSMVSPTSATGTYAGSVLGNSSSSGGGGSAPGDAILTGGHGAQGVQNFGVLNEGYFPGGGAGGSYYSQSGLPVFSPSRGGDGLVIIIQGQPRT